MPRGIYIIFLWKTVIANNNVHISLPPESDNCGGEITQLTANIHGLQHPISLHSIITDIPLFT